MHNIFVPGENDRISNIEEKNSIKVKFSDKDQDKVKKLMSIYFLKIIIT